MNRTLFKLAVLVSFVTNSQTIIETDALKAQ